MNNPAVRTDNMPRISWVMVASLAAVGLLKLLFVANQEIVAIPHDPLNYVRQADSLGQYFGFQATGYTTWLWLVNSLGVPQRIAIEILWLFSAIFLTFSVVPDGGRRWPVLPCFTTVVFAPQTYHLFDWTVTEGFYLCMSALALGCAVRVFRRVSFPMRVGTLVMLGLVFGVMAITRNEAPLLFIFLVFLSVLVGIFDWTCLRHTFVRSCYGALCALAVAGTSAAIIPAVLTLYNGLTYGVFTHNISVLPSQMKLLKTLAEIETDEPNFRFLPITRKAREMAYAQSPTFARFREVIENPQNIFQQYSLRMLGRPGEIGAGWIWLVFNAAAPSLGITTYNELDATYLLAVREIEAGFASGKYHRRFVLHPFLGRDSASWTPFLGQGLRIAVAGALTPLGAMENADLQPSDISLYDRVCMRRLSLDTTSVHIHGWVFSKNRDFPITGVTVEDPPNVLNALSKLSPRTDVQKAFQREGFIPFVEMGFDIFRSVRKQNPDVTLSLFSGPEIVGQIKHFVAGKTHVIPSAHGDILLGVDEVSIMPPRSAHSVRERVKTAFLGIATSATVWVVGLSLSVACLLVLVFIKQFELGHTWLATAGVFAAWAVIHLGFYALLSAAAWEAEPRYLQNTAFFGFFFIVTTVLGAADYLIGWLLVPQRSRPPSDAVPSC